MLVIHNERMVDWIRSDYSSTQLEDLNRILRKAGTLSFPALANGLFPAAVAEDYTGYSNVWVRDNIHVAHAHLFAGETEAAVKTVRTLMSFFHQHSHRLQAVIAGISDPEDVMNRPHIRFNGQTLDENPERWAHAQNDAIGYFLWLLGRLVLADLMTVSTADVALLAGFARYLMCIQYWEDEDSGHWEETRKISASSIGVAAAGLIQIREWLQLSQRWSEFHFDSQMVTKTQLDDSIELGLSALQMILPYECRQPSETQLRRYDAALLFLVFPVEIVTGEVAEQIVNETIERLSGPFGIRRYLGDSYWCADYSEKLDENQRTADFSDDLSSRDALLEPGAEAQWCIFDSVISVYFGRKFAHSGDIMAKQKQIHHFNRALGQLTADSSRFGGLKCPESYYRDRGRHVPNDITPLLWTAANLWMALEQMQSTAELSNDCGESIQE